MTDEHAEHAEHEATPERSAAVAGPDVLEAHAATQLSVLPTQAPGATGVPAVDAALDRLAELADLGGDADQHVAVFEDVHDRLQGALTGPDAPAP